VAECRSHAYCARVHRTLGALVLLVLFSGCGGRSHPSSIPPPADTVLAPRGSAVEVQAIRASSGEPAELVVTWHRDSREQRTFGASIWVLRGTMWRSEYSLRYRLSNDQPFEHVGAFTGDGTADGHADAVIVPSNNGSGGCSDYHAIASIHGRLREVLTRTHACESANVVPNHGDLLVSHTVGRCPDQPEPAHCYGGTKVARLRWTGDRYVSVGWVVDCNFPQLNPQRGCRL
jgi:hypothetical protein